MGDDRQELLFSYGTLQQRDVQLAKFGRILEASADAVLGYRQSLLEIRDPEVILASGKRFHPIVEATGRDQDEVSGAVFRLTARELAVADAYEVADYKRVRVRLRSGREAWAYVKA